MNEPDSFVDCSARFPEEATTFASPGSGAAIRDGEGLGRTGGETFSSGFACVREGFTWNTLPHNVLHVCSGLVRSGSGPVRSGAPSLGLSPALGLSPGPSPEPERWSVPGLLDTRQLLDNASPGPGGSKC
jgi:hypothetical protein